MGKNFLGFMSVAVILLIGGLLIFDKGTEKVVENNGNRDVEKKTEDSMEDLRNMAGYIRVGSAWVQVEIADTGPKREQGLSGRNKLGENEGMLFVYDKPGLYSFWMKDMLFSLDIIWIGRDLEIVDMQQNISPETYPETFTPREESFMVLEVSAGWAQNHGVLKGLKVDIQGIESSISTLLYEELSMPSFVHHIVPFSSQAPLGNWSDINQQNGCEEASALMAMRWVQGKELSAEEAEREIIAISDYEIKTYGDFHDTSAKDTVERIFKGYFAYQNVTAQYDIGVRGIKKELAKGNLVIVPVSGQILKNPHYTPPGPIEHMVVVTGYDNETKEFIVHDPGTRFGENFRYSYETLGAAFQDYETGYHEPISERHTAMIIVQR